MLVKKAVFPVAGIGSRFLPATKATPKEMLPIVDKPLIQYAVEEAVAVGVTEIIFITHPSKRAIEDYFSQPSELEQRLIQQGKHDLAEKLEDMAIPNVKFTFIHQHEPLGLGHAVLCAEEAVGEEPFLVLLADDLLEDKKLPSLSAMIEMFDRDGSSILAVEAVPHHSVNQYGIIELMNGMRIKSVVEKPEIELAPSNLAVIGRYLLTPKIFTCLQETNLDHRGEIQLTEGIQRLLQYESVLAYRIHGKRYDCGSKLGYLKATVAFGQKHPEVGQAFSRYLRGEEMTI